MNVQSHRDISSGVDRRLWALDNDQSMRVLRLYDEGRALITSYLRKEQEIKTNSVIFLGEPQREIDVTISDRANKSIPNEGDGSPSMATHIRLEIELKTIDEQLDDVATRCSEIQLCPALIQPIFSRFPRELRDYIYDLLWSNDDIQRLDQAMSFIPANIRYLDQPAVDLPDLPVPIFANPRFVGTEFAIEFALRYVRALNAAEIDHRCVRAHLNRDRFGCLYFPLKEYINCLIITVGDSFGFTLEEFAETAWKDSLDSLLTLQNNRSIRIIVYLPKWMQYREKFFRVLEITRPFLCKFRENSMDVKILGYDFFNPIEDHTEDIFSEQLNHYFDRTPEEWLDMKAKEIKEIPDAKQRRACKGILRAMRMNLDFYNKQNRDNEVTQASVPDSRGTWIVEMGCELNVAAGIPPALFMIQSGKLGFFGRVDMRRNPVLYAGVALVSDILSDFGRPYYIYGQT